MSTSKPLYKCLFIEAETSVIFEKNFHCFLGQSSNVLSKDIIDEAILFLKF